MSIEIPSSVTSIEERAFWNCKSLESIVLPGIITNIGKGAISSSTLIYTELNSEAHKYAEENKQGYIIYEYEIKENYVVKIKPNTTYRYTESDIDYNGKTFTMVFDITDKYYKSGTLAIGDLNIKIDGETPNWDNTGVHGVTKELTSEDITNTVKGEDKVIGKRYTLKLTHLEQLEKLAGKETMDYSGVITVAVPAEKLVDTTENVKKELSEAVQLKETRKVDGVDTQVQYGVKYTLTFVDTFSPFTYTSILSAVKLLLAKYLSVPFTIIVAVCPFALDVELTFSHIG